MNRPKLSHAVLVASSLAVAAICSSDMASGAGVTRQSYSVGGKSALTLEGVVSGPVTNVSGGTAVAAVVAENHPGFPKKHLGPPTYEDLEMSVGPGSGQPAMEWIRTTLANPQSPPRKTGFVAYANMDETITDRLSFQNAFIDEVGFPLLDAESHDAVSIKLSLAVDRTARSRDSGRVATFRQQPKPFLASNFRMSLSGQVLSRVSHIEPLYVRFKAITDTVGDHPEYEKIPTSADISNLEFVIDASAAEPLYTWHQDFVVNGHNGDANERTATIEYLSSDFSTVLYTLNLAGVGPIRVAPEKQTAGASVRKVRVKAYVENVTFSYTPHGI